MPLDPPFDNPIVPTKGKTLTTLKDAAAHIMKLPKAKQQSPEWQAATEALLMAAEDRGPLMHVTSECCWHCTAQKQFPSTIHQRRNTGDGES